VGHTGTLDPFATGLLVMLLGRATRLARFVSGLPKTYLATARLGQGTTTDDLTGEPTGPRIELEGIAESDLRPLLAGFQGVHPQRPPQYSAKRLGGERSYQKARRGEVVELEEREITIHAISLIEFRCPDLTFRTTVSAGTYVRAMARDIGTRLGTGAHLTALRREAIGRLRIEDAVPLERLTKDTPPRSPVDVLGHLPVVELDRAASGIAVHGGAVARPDQPDGIVVLVDTDRLIGVAQSEGGWLKPKVVVAEP
jgi:tRNA pseudouridine55 synthase